MVNEGRMLEVWQMRINRRVCNERSFAKRYCLYEVWSFFIHVLWLQTSSCPYYNKNLQSYRTGGNFVVVWLDVFSYTCIF